MMLRKTRLDEGDSLICSVLRMKITAACQRGSVRFNEMARVNCKALYEQSVFLIELILAILESYLSPDLQWPLFPRVHVRDLPC